MLYLKDLAYFIGQEKAWSFLQTVTTQEEFDLAFAGKTDMTQPDHYRIAQEIAATLRS